MGRWAGFIICAIIGVALFYCGLQVPVHLRAVDPAVLHQAGRGTATLVDQGLALVEKHQLGPAEMYFAAARSAGLANADRLGRAVDELDAKQPGLKTAGRTETGNFGAALAGSSGPVGSKVINAILRSEPFMEFIMRTENRTRELAVLRASPDAVAQALLDFRYLTNTVLFPASGSASGQALDGTVCIGGLLAERGHLSVEFSNAVLNLATSAIRTGNSQPLEEVLSDLMSLGQRFNWGQLAEFMKPIKDVETLRILTERVRRGEELAVLYAAVSLSGNAAGVAKYVMNFSETGLSDLRVSLAYGAGGVNELVQRNQRLCTTALCARVKSFAPGGRFGFAADYARKEPGGTLAVKWLLYLVGGFFLAAAVHCLRRVTLLEKPLEVRGFHLARESLFALGFLLVVLLLSEPFLAQEGQKGVLPFRLRLPMVGSAAPTVSPGAPSKFMNQSTFLTMLLFFVLQALLYVASLVKLAEIRRQRVPARVKIKLLKNEDHLFDAGLYLGFLGTIISLVLVSVGAVSTPSLMAAYSSTSFGILFVVIFKVCHLRPASRILLLEAEHEVPVARVAAPAETTLAAPL